MRGAGRALLCALALWAGAAPAQEPTPAESAVVLIDSEQLFAESLFGQRIMRELQAQTEDLAAENRRIEADLRAEEQSLTERRAGMSVEAFRAEAEAFDRKVQEIRQAQDAKERALQQSVNAGRESFIRAAQPDLVRLMRARGASVILDRRAVFLGTAQADITEAAIAAVNAGIGDGTAEDAGAPTGDDTPGQASSD